MPITIKEIKDDIKRRPRDSLAVGRTVMANERTLMGFIRTGIGLFATGVGLIKFLENPFVVAFGWCCIVLSAGALVWGITRYRLIKKLLTDFAISGKGSNLDE
ncbi:MAG: DUF202 domain-containing protein [Planctomycetota bacterium]|jgi:putative membrane protein